MREIQPPGEQERVILSALEVFFETGSVIELRALRGKQTASGYFNDHDLLAKEAANLDREGFHVYMPLNEIDPALLARAANRVERWAGTATSDNDIVRRRWMLVDLDPERPSGISATEEERKAAVQKANEIMRFLKEQGWPKPVVADSGNGVHLLYRVDLPNDQESRELVKALLETFAFLFDDEQVKVDTSVHNAARITKPYGVTARKGDHTPERPHRPSRIVSVPEE